MRRWPTDTDTGGVTHGFVVAEVMGIEPSTVGGVTELTVDSDQCAPGADVPATLSVVDASRLLGFHTGKLTY